MEEKGLTGIKETAKGFVGPYIKRGYTKETNKPFIKFDLAASPPNEPKGIYTTWRHCIGYGPAAEALKEMKKGDIAKVTGYLITEVIKDENGKPVSKDGQPVCKEKLIFDQAEYQEHQKKQPELVNSGSRLFEV